MGVCAFGGANGPLSCETGHYREIGS